MRHLITGSSPQPIPWQHALPQTQFRIFFKNLVQETTDAFSHLPFDYYESAWTAGSRVLSSLRPARIDLDDLQRCLAGAGQNAAALEGFRPKRSGFSHPVVYDRFATRTGRLTVTEGPNILVLKKTCRSVIRSSFEGGTIAYLDFRALEARIVLAEAGRFSDAEDMYEDVSQSLFGGRISRDVVKTAVLAELYGISRSSLKARLGVSDKEIDAFIGAIRLHFGVEPLKRRLREEASKTGTIVNRFGRPIPVPQGQDNLLVNTYAQSSGVDVAMLGFDAVIQKLGSEGIRPLFVLHDALLLDVDASRLGDVETFDSVSVPGYDKPFPLKLETIG
jgi:DNA polymerase family A